MTKHDKILGISARGDDLTFKTEPDFDPKSQWQLMDGIEASMFAMIFCEWGSETSIRKWCDHFSSLLRKHSQNLGAVKEAWDTLSWQLALDMRQGVTFDLSTSNMMKDVSLWLEFFVTAPSRKRPLDSKYNNPFSPQKKLKGNKGSGKGKGKDHGRNLTLALNYQQPQQTKPFNAWPSPAPANSSPTVLCKDFQTGRCSRGASCRFNHACGTCNRKGHGAHECRSGKGKGKGKNADSSRQPQH